MITFWQNISTHHLRREKTRLLFVKHKRHFQLHVSLLQRFFLMICVYQCWYEHSDHNQTKTRKHSLKLLSEDKWKNLYSSTQTLQAPINSLIWVHFCGFIEKLINFIRPWSRIHVFVNIFFSQGLLLVFDLGVQFLRAGWPGGHMNVTWTLLFKLSDVMVSMVSSIEIRSTWITKVKVVKIWESKNKPWVKDVFFREIKTT